MEESVRIEEISGVEKKIYISVDPEAVDKKFDVFFESVKKESNIPGFRKGKAPVSVLKKRFKSEALGAISQILLGEYYQTAINDNNLNPIGNPVIITEDPDNPTPSKYPGKFNDDNSYSVELKIEVLPVIDPVGFDDIELEAAEHNMDELIAAKMTEYQDQFAERNQIKGSGALEGDAMVIDYSGCIDGDSFDSGEGLHINELGSGNLVPGFEEQLVGAKEGQDITVKVRFPDNYSAAHLSNKDAEFDVKVHSIVRKTPAALDDDLAMMAGFETINDLKQNVVKVVGKEVKASDQKLLESAIVSKLIENNDFEVPKSLIKGESDRILKHNKINAPTEEILTAIETAARDNVKREILLDAIFEKEKLEIAPEDLSQRLDNEAEASGKTKDELVSTLYNTNQMDNFVSIIRVRKTMEHLIALNTKESE